jgi:hypothetical protein
MMPSSTAVGRARDRAAARSPSGGRGRCDGARAVALISYSSTRQKGGYYQICGRVIVWNREWVIMWIKFFRFEKNSKNDMCPDGGVSQAELEIYKTAVEMADRISVRRGITNSFFLAVQSSFVALVGLSKEGAEGGLSERLILLFVGVLLSFVWWMQLGSYRRLNEAKFSVITDIEKRLPVQIYSDEWAYLKGSSSVRSGRVFYIELGKIERYIPLAYALIHFFIFSAGFDWSVFWGWIAS